MSPKQQHVLAIDLGATNVRAALVSSRGTIVRKIQRGTDRSGKDGAAVTTQIIEMVEGLLRAARAERDDRASIAGIGISSIGPLDYLRGGPTSSPNVPYSFISLVKPLEKRFRLPVTFLNDANAAVIGEQRFGAGKGIKNLVYITISTGIGGGAIVDNKLLFGRSGNAAEVGHLVVDTAYNLPCTCGKGAGHWEGYASGRNIPRFFHAWLAEKKQNAPFQYQEAKDIFLHARKQDPAALVFLDELARVNARAISSVIVAYDPELITLGGSVALGNSRALIGGVEKYADRYLPLPKIKITSLGEDISLLGAAAAVFAGERD